MAKFYQFQATEQLIPNPPNPINSILNRQPMGRELIRRSKVAIFRLLNIFNV
jgi:hypothetical protein